jgi:hypothetical protein
MADQVHVRLVGMGAGSWDVEIQLKGTSFRDGQWQGIVDCYASLKIVFL